MFHTVQIPLMDDFWTRKKVQRVERLTARDSTVIKRYLLIIEQEEKEIVSYRKGKPKISASSLDRLTLTSKSLTRRQKDGIVKTTPGRAQVKFDLKNEFQGRITTRELKECRDTAIDMWESYMEACQKHERRFWRFVDDTKYIDKEDSLAATLRWWSYKRPHSPCQAPNYRVKKLPRRANIGTSVFWHIKSTNLTKYWIEWYYPESGVHIWLPANPSSYHLQQLQHGKLKTVQLVKHTNKRWYLHMTLDYAIEKPVNTTSLTDAVVSIDLGIKKAVTAVLLTADKSQGNLHRQDIQFFEHTTRKRVINQLDTQIATLQRAVKQSSKHDRSTDNITRKLRQLSSRRRDLAEQYDHELTAQLVTWLKQLSHRYRLRIVLGELTGIRHSRRKGDGKSRRHRRELHRWAFRRFTNFLTYKLHLRQVPHIKLETVPEQWTSRRCSKCGSLNTHRPFQALIICYTCGAQLHADINGATNIAFKLIVSLDEVCFDQWLINPFLEQKYQNTNQSSRSVKYTGRTRAST